ncbi:MAG TPA: GMC family oxidoreductase [Gemmatimonadaceae bacterium]|nr:GMC family oxidoreductase [Gemmatimonadaceae bacterium]
MNAEHRHLPLAPLQQRGATYQPSEEVDFVIVGSGAAGGVMAKELSQAGFSVVVLEQGPWRNENDFPHDEIKIWQHHHLTNDWNKSPTTFRATETDKANRQPALIYGRGVGGTTVHFSGNYWRFKPIDFREVSTRGAMAGTSLADWPITYEELEPYYTKVDWEVGVAGAPGPFDPPRSRPYPMPPHHPKSQGVLLERAAKQLGWTAFAAPMAINSRFYNGRSQCVQCGFCLGFGCEVRAKSSSLVTVIPVAMATGRCEVRPNSYVRKVEVSPRGRVTGVKYFDANRREFYQLAKAVVLCANGAETPRLLLNSRSNAFPNGLANSSGYVGRNLMFNGAGMAMGRFENEVNGYKGLVASRIIWDTYELDPKLGLVGGGGFDFRFDQTPINFAFGGLAPGEPTWGRAFKRHLAQNFNRSLLAYGHTTSLPVMGNSISLDPGIKDDWGLPALRVTYQDHEQDLKMYKYFAGKSEELLKAAGATTTWQLDVSSQQFGVHLLGTCRMGNDPRTSVVDRYHRAHDVKNLFIVDGSSFVTSGRGQPTMTIQALAFRAGEHVANFAKRGEI